MGFDGVGAVGEPTFPTSLEYFGEIVSDFVAGHFYCAESLDSRGVDQVAVGLTGRRWEWEHFGECGSVHTGVVNVGDLSSAEVELRDKSIDKG